MSCEVEERRFPANPHDFFGNARPRFAFGHQIVSPRSPSMKSLLISTVAALGLAGMAVSAATPASAQDIRLGIGPSGPRIGVYDERPAVVERRVVRRSYVDDDEDCRVIVKRRVNAYGETVVKRTRVCD